jgi:hypothetical protein
VPVRFDYTIAGAVLASLVLFSESLAWQTAITATVAAYAALEPGRGSDSSSLTVRSGCRASSRTVGQPIPRR